MKLEEIQLLWDNDTKIDRTELGIAAMDIPKLHSKYYNIFIDERIKSKQLDLDYRTLYKLKYEYYIGSLSEEELKENGWEPFQYRILKTDIPMYIQADIDLQKIEQKIEIQKIKIDFLESIIKNLPARGFQIKSAIEWEKFKVGA